LKRASNLIGRISNEQVQNETSDRNAIFFNRLVNPARRSIGLAGRFDGDVVVTSNLFEGDGSSTVAQPVDFANKYTQESRCLFDINLLSRIARGADPRQV